MFSFFHGFSAPQLYFIHKRWSDVGDVIWWNARKTPAIKKNIVVGVANHARAAAEASKFEKSSKINIFGQKECENPISPPNRYDIRKARKKSYLRSEHFNFMKTLFQPQITNKRSKNHVTASIQPFLTAIAASTQLRFIFFI